MPIKPLNIVSVTAELAPFAKTGGLGTVARALPIALHDLGHRVTIVTPLHRSAKEHDGSIRLFREHLPVKVGSTQGVTCQVFLGELEKNVPVYFIDFPEYFSSHPSIYKSPFENKRFFLFDHAAITLLNELNLIPDVIQCHDWHAGLIPCLIRKDQNHSLVRNTATIFTIHNLSFQLGTDWWTVPESRRDTGITPLPDWSDDEALRHINFAIRAIQCADVVSTVSERYSQEILTKKFGENLDRELKKHRADLYGIINGIDYNEYNPAKDPGLAAAYDSASIPRKQYNKLALQRLFGIRQSTAMPVIGMVSRITEQKGFELILEILDILMALKLQIVIMGSGDSRYEAAFREAERRYPTKFGYRPFEQKYETMIYAGSDFFLMPSRFEPCGLGQLISLRYGSIPIVHAVGGLSETITNYNPRTGRGNGFVFASYDSRALLAAIVRAIENWQSGGKAWENLVKHAMSRVFSWELPARRYVVLFRHAIRKHAAEIQQSAQR